MIESKYSEAEEEATELVTREVRRKSVNDEAVQRAVELASQIEVPASSLLKEDAALAASQVVEAAAVIQNLAVSEAEVLGFVEVTEAKEEIAGTLGAAETSETYVSMSDALTSNVEIVDLGSTSETLTNSPDSSSSSFILSSSDEDDIPLSKIYSSINKTPSKTKTSQKPDDIFEPMYPSVQERMIEMQQKRIDACKYLPADHPLQPPVIEAIQGIPAVAEGGDDPVGTNLASGSNVSSKSISPSTHNTDIPEPSILSNLESHYLGELPEYVPNLQTTSDIASDEVMAEDPQHQQPNSPTNNSVPTSEIPVPKQSTSEQSTSEQTASEQTASVQIASELLNQTQSSTFNIHESEQITNDQPSPSKLAIQPVKPARTNVPSPPTMFLDSTVLTHVCESIFHELNCLIEARNNLIHEESYEKQWARLRERVDFIFSELQRTCLDAQESAQAKLQAWLKGVISNLDEVKVLRTWVKTPLCLEARSLIPSSIHHKDLNLDWVTKLNLKEASSELALLQRNSLLEKETHHLKKELLEQKLMFLEYKSKTDAQLEEAKIREEKLLKSNEEFKREMLIQSEKTQKIMEQLMEMMKHKQT